MAKFRIVLHTSNKRKDGSNPVCLRITKRGKLKYIYGAQNETYIEGWEKSTSNLLIYKRLCKI